jgi:hypothetical protein
MAQSPNGAASMRSVLLIVLSACSTSSIVDVDASTTLDTGRFDSVSVDVATPDGGVSVPSDRCATPQMLTFIDGEVSVRDDTSSATDEFLPLDCQSRGTAGTLNGPQRYYALSVTRGATYSFVLNATFHSVLYAFDARGGCSQEALQSACRSEGASSFASGLIHPGTGGPNPGVVFDVPPDFAPAEDMPLILVVDSDGGGGGYELTVQEMSP